MLKYRPEVDGLRAVAVLPVILFHANVPGFDGGFVGVDVFFVISGYLISGILMKELRDGTFSLRSFYERRVRRIFPALFAMLGATWLVGYLVLVPRELTAMARSLLQATLFYANVGFSRQAGYFEPKAETKPLLHTWSLCVEEQFYLVFPLLLGCLWRWSPRSIRVVLPLLLAGSLLLSVRAVSNDPMGAFYFAHLRAWELLLGTMVTLQLVPVVPSRPLRGAISGLGLGAILYSVFTYTGGMTFPGLAALLPTLGSSAFLYAESSERTWVGQTLARRPFVFIGLISYALYLWHWPALVYGRLLSGRELGPVQLALVFALTLALAMASRALLEDPVRKRVLLLKPRAVLGFAVAAMATACLLAFVSIRGEGLPQRLPQAARTLLDVGRNPAEAQVAACIPGSQDTTTRLQGMTQCDVGEPKAATKTFLIWGDSHAQSMSPAAALAAQGRGVRGTVVTQGGCPPAGGVHLAFRPDRCSRFHQHVTSLLESSPDYESVVLVGRWGAWLEQRRYQGAAHITVQYGAQTASRFEEGVQLVQRGLESTLAFLHAKGKRVTIVGPVPEADTNVPNALARRSWRHLAYDIRPDSAEARARQRPFDAMLAQLRTHYTFEVIEPVRVLCKTSRCDVTYGARSLYFDDQHLIGTSAPLFAPLLAPLL
ncbi:MAG: acyltransferase family protein [Myxococcales bacterium]